MCSAATAKPIVSIMALRYALRSVASQARSNCAERRHLVVMSSAAIAVTTSASVTTAVLWANSVMGSWRLYSQPPSQRPVLLLPITVLL